MTRFCFIFGFIGLSLWADAPPVSTRSVVRSDSRGRLVRRVEMHPSAARAPQAKPEIQKLIADRARKHDLDPLLVDSVIQVESNYNATAVSPKGALGLMQLIPATAERFGVRDPFDAAENIEGGVKYLKHLHELYQGDQKLALAAYNAGEGAVARYGTVPPYAETQSYVVEVGRRYQKARRLRPADEPAALAREPKIEQFTDTDGRIHFELR